eukprot:scaffold51993_cov24-Prasinocladus_malaysianus.AAC.1
MSYVLGAQETARTPEKPGDYLSPEERACLDALLDAGEGCLLGLQLDAVQKNYNIQSDQDEVFSPSVMSFL